jgi:hypothetical protein
MEERRLSSTPSSSQQLTPLSTPPSPGPMMGRVPGVPTPAGAVPGNRPPSSFGTRESVRPPVSCLSGKALEWVNAVWGEGDAALDHYEDFTRRFRAVYDLMVERLVSLKAGVEERTGLCFGLPNPCRRHSFFFVKKKDGGLRWCIDYRGINQITVRYSYPLPLIASSIESMYWVRFFIKLDLRSAYNLVRIGEGNEWKTVFSTTPGHYEYLVMPYRLMNAPSVFQAFVDKIFWDLHGQGVVVYIDDILMYSATSAEHVSLERKVLGRLL